MPFDSGHGAGPQVAGQAEFDVDIGATKFIEERRVAKGRKAMSQTVGPAILERIPDGIRSAMLAGVDLDAQAGVAPSRKRGGEAANALAIFRAYQGHAYDQPFAAQFDERLRVPL